MDGSDAQFDLELCLHLQMLSYTVGCVWRFRRFVLSTKIPYAKLVLKQYIADLVNHNQEKMTIFSAFSV